MTIRWGFLGAGFIAGKALAPAVHASTNGEIYAVASRDPKRSAALNPKKVHATYQDLLDDPQVDAVYISLANDAHAEWTIKALQASKHVLCEKPLAMNAQEAIAMNDAAIANNKLLTEAVWSLWHPRFKRIVDLVQSGGIGEVQSIDSAFTFPGSLEGNYRLDPAKGGGSLFDVGPYVFHSWLAVAGIDQKLTVNDFDQSMSTTGVDMTTTITGNLSTIHVSGLTSFEQPENQRFNIVGSESTIQCVGTDAFMSWHAPSKLAIGQTIEEFAPIDPYQEMAQHFAATIKGEESWLLPKSSSIRVMQIFDQLQLMDNR